MKYTSKLILNGETYEFAAPSGGGGRQPGANTIAYYPLNSTSNFTDQSGNGYDLTNNGVTITTEDGISCAYFSGVGTILTSLSPSFGSTRTLIAWYKGSSDSSNAIILWTSQYVSSGTFGTCLIGGNKPQISNFYNHGSSYDTVASTNEWHLICGVYDNGLRNLYLDGELITSDNRITNDTTGLAIGGRPDDENLDRIAGYISNAIFENKARTAQEVADYYNQTKSLYGIS